MEQTKIKKITKDVVVLFLTFMTGFIGTIILIMKRTSDLTTVMISEQKEMIESVKVFGLKVAEFHGRFQDGAYIIDISKNGLYTAYPFIAGFTLIAIVLIIVLILKRTTR